MSFRLKVAKNKNVDISEPIRTQFADNLGGAVEYSLAHLVYKVLEIMGSGLGTFAAGFLVKFLEMIEPEVIDYTSPLLDEILSWDGMPPKFRKFFAGLREAKDPAGGAILASLGSAAGGAVVGSVLNTLLAPLTYYMNAQIKPARPSPAEIYAMLWRGLINEEQKEHWLLDEGWPDSVREAYQKVLRPRLPVTQVAEAMLRGVITEQEFRSEMGARGYTKDDVDILLELVWSIPGASDLIRMSVREAFTPEVIAKFQLESDYPSELTEYAEKQGLSKEWAMKYWIAHWTLPSLGAGYEMLHRRIIDETTLEMLIKAQDISPFWRDKLIALSYQPYTRVDVRRMFQAGVLSADDVYENYLDIGYDPDHALKMTEWTIKEYQESCRELTKSDILAAYADSRLRREEAENFLIEIGYAPEEADFLLSREDFKKAEKYEKERLKTIKSLFVNQQMDESDLFAELGKLGLDSTQMQDLCSLWTIERNRKIRRLTVAQLFECFSFNIISEEELRRELSGYRYSDYYIDCLIELYKLKAAAKEVEE